MQGFKNAEWSQAAWIAFLFSSEDTGQKQRDYVDYVEQANQNPHVIYES